LATIEAALEAPAMDRPDADFVIERVVTVRRAQARRPTHSGRSVRTTIDNESAAGGSLTRSGSVDICSPAGGEFAAEPLDLDRLR
jgi:hypothetical protein